MKTNIKTWLPLAVAVALGMSGCQEAEQPHGDPAPISDLPPGTMDDHSGHDHGTHAHPSEGPHHGDLVELGNEEYHAEVVHDEEHGSVTIYILDGSATKQVAIDATELTINVTHDGQPEQFIVAAAPDSEDEGGKSSRFVTDDKELAEHLDEHGTSPRLVVKIDGKSFRGEIKHEHDHGSHDHAHSKDE